MGLEELLNGIVLALLDSVLTGEAMELPGDGLVIITYTAEPDSPAAEVLRFLSSWATNQASTPGPTRKRALILVACVQSGVVLVVGELDG